MAIGISDLKSQIHFCQALSIGVSFSAGSVFFFERIKVPLGYPFEAVATLEAAPTTEVEFN